MVSRRGPNANEPETVSIADRLSFAFRPFLKGLFISRKPFSAIKFYRVHGFHVRVSETGNGLRC